MKHTVRLSPGRFVNLDTYTKEGTPSTVNKSMESVKTFFVYTMATVGCAIIIGAALGVDITQPNPQVPSPPSGVEQPRKGV